MRYYIATRLENHAQHNAVRDALAALGHEITYDWTTHGPVWRSGIERIAEVATAEQQGVVTADVVIVLLLGGRGTHTELGIALGLKKPVIIDSPDAAVFGATPETCAFYHASGVLPVSGSTPEQIAEIVHEAMKLRRNGTSGDAYVCETAKARTARTPPRNRHLKGESK